jgi:hypothetical protein
MGKFMLAVLGDEYKVVVQLVRRFVDTVVARYLDCGVAESGSPGSGATHVLRNGC